MRVDVKLYGHLAEHFGPEVRSFDVQNVAEVFSALRSQLDGFKQYLIAHSDPGYFVIVNGQPLAYEDLQLLIVEPDTLLKVVPATKGSGDGKGIGLVIGGALLAVLSFGVGAAASAGVLAAGWGTAATLGAGIGLAMTSAGVSSLLSPQPSTPAVAPREAERRKQYRFDSLSPTINQGIPIPIRYGRQVVEGYPISIRMSVVNDIG